MYTLRQLKDNGIEINSLLGFEYAVIHLLKSEDLFKIMHKESFNEDHTPESKCYAIVTAGSNCYPLYLGDRNFIVNESGKTFSNISY